MITQLGVLIENTDCFVPFQCAINDVEGVSGLNCRRIGKYKPDPNAIFNSTPHVIRYGTVTWPANSLSLHPGPQHERATARVQIGKGGVHVIVADFRGLDDFTKPIDVRVQANGATLWQSVSGDRFAAAVHLPPHATVDFSVGVSPGDNYRDSTTVVRFAIFRTASLGRGKSGLFRVDDAITGLDDVTARRWAEAVDPTDAVELPAAPSKATPSWLSAQAKRYLTDPIRELMVASFNRSLDDLVQWVLETPQTSPRQSYTHIFIPRSGSTVLMEMVSNTHLLGYPHEYMEENMFMFFSILRHMAESNENYFDFVRNRMQTPNGVFGIEIDIERLGYSHPELKNVKKHPVIYHTRQNIVMQAISLFFSSPDGFNATFDRALITSIISDLLGMMSECEALFTEADITPTRIVYEDLLADPAGSIARIADAVGVSVGDLPEIEMSALNWKVMRTSKSWDYGRRVVTEGGELLGYDVVECETGLQAVLAGMDGSRLPPGDDDLFPLRFFAPDAETLRGKLDAAVAEFEPA